MQAKPDPDADLKPRIELAERDGVHHAVLKGNWTTRRVAAIDPTIRQIEKNKAIKSLRVDLSGVGRIDTAGAWLVERLLSAMRSRGVEPAVTGGQRGGRGSCSAPSRKPRRATAIRRPSRVRGFVLRFLEGLGRHMYTIAGDAKAVDVHPRRDDPRLPDEGGTRPRRQHRGDRQPDRPDGRRRASGRGPDVDHRRRHRGAAGRLPAALFRRRDLRRRPGRHPGVARDGRAVDGDHDRRPLGKRDHRRDRLDEDARGGRCADRDRSQSGRRAGLSAPRRAGDRAALPDDRRQFRRARRRHRHFLLLFQHIAGRLHRPAARRHRHVDASSRGSSRRRSWR